MSLVEVTTVSKLIVSSRNRNVREITFDKNKKIGRYPYHDLFGDGSFYLLDVPGVCLPFL